MSCLLRGTNGEAYTLQANIPLYHPAQILKHCSLFFKKLHFMFLAFKN